jgi:DNA-binding XRE family transcriptional regulator
MQGEIVKSGQPSAEPFERSAIVMAVAVVYQRLVQLPKEDLQELYELAMEIPKAQKSEDPGEIEAIRVAMLEILDQKTAGVRFAEMPERTASSGSWINYISGKVQQMRKSANMTQEELSKKSGLPQSHISRIESGKLSPSRVTLERIAKALGCSVGQLDPSA